MQTATPPYCDSKVPVIRVTGARSDGDEGCVIASLSCEAISLGFVILRNEGSDISAFKILRFAQNDRPRLLRSARNDGRWGKRDHCTGGFNM